MNKLVAIVQITNALDPACKHSEVTHKLIEFECAELAAILEGRSTYHGVQVVGVEIKEESHESR